MPVFGNPENCYQSMQSELPVKQHVTSLDHLDQYENHSLPSRRQKGRFAMKNMKGKVASGQLGLESKHSCQQKSHAEGIDLNTLNELDGYECYNLPKASKPEEKKKKDDVDFYENYAETVKNS